MKKLSILFIIWTICTSTAENKPLKHRQKRFILQSGVVTNNVPFPTPTTYPVPTIPNRKNGASSTSGSQNTLSASFLMTSSKVQCPHKRSADYKRVYLNDNLMQELYLELVGSIDRNIYAGNLDEANANFRHILPSSTNRTKDWRRRSKIKKSDFINDLNIYTTWYNSLLKDLTATNETFVDVDTSRDNGVSDELENILRKIELTEPKLKLELGLKHDIDELKDFRLPRKRIKRTTAGAIRSQTEYCTQRGSSTGTGFLHLCSACAVTTQFPEDMFPRYTNEITCDPTDCKCFQATKSIVYGKCQPIIKDVIMLKRNKDGCRMVIKNGQNVIVDDWKIYQQPLHVGCECVLNKNALYAPLVPQH